MLPTGLQPVLILASPDCCEANSVPSAVVRGYDFHKLREYWGVSIYRLLLIDSRRGRKTTQ